LVVLKILLSLRHNNKQIGIMKAILEQELRDLQVSFKSGKSGMTTNEYTSTYHQLAQRIKKLN